jgi:hypothetical protein
MLLPPPRGTTLNLLLQMASSETTFVLVRRLAKVHLVLYLKVSVVQPQNIFAFQNLGCACEPHTQIPPKRPS